MGILLYALDRYDGGSSVFDRYGGDSEIADCEGRYCCVEHGNGKVRRWCCWPESC